MLAVGGLLIGCVTNGDINAAVVAHRYIDDLVAAIGYPSEIRDYRDGAKLYVWSRSGISSLYGNTYSYNCRIAAEVDEATGEVLGGNVHGGACAGAHPLLVESVRNLPPDRRTEEPE